MQNQTPQFVLNRYCAGGGGNFGRIACILSRLASKATTDFGQVAQSVEQGTENPRVGGSIPSLTTILGKGLRKWSVRSDHDCSCMPDLFEAIYRQFGVPNLLQRDIVSSPVRKCQVRGCDRNSEFFLTRCAVYVIKCARFRGG